jgi:hypothetical protein
MDSEKAIRELLEDENPEYTEAVIQFYKKELKGKMEFILVEEKDGKTINAPSFSYCTFIADFSDEGAAVLWHNIRDLKKYVDFEM